MNELAVELGCDWHTINDSVIAYGGPLVDHPDRIGTVTAVGLDEVLFARLGPWRTLTWSTQVVDVRRGGPVEQPHAGRSVSGGVRVKPVRVTVDLDPGDYDALRDFAHSERMTHTDVIRALVRLLDDPSVSQQVSKSVSQ